MFFTLYSFFKQWWRHSFLSTWYVKHLVRTYRIDLTSYTFQCTRKLTLAAFLERAYRVRPPLQKQAPHGISAPVAGMVTQSGENHLTIHTNIQHYHRIHLPFSGSITHYTRAPYTTTTIHITAPNGLTGVLTIQTPHEPYGTVLRYNKRRNYHLQGREIGIICASQAMVTLQTNMPCFTSSDSGRRETTCNAPL